MDINQFNGNSWEEFCQDCLHIKYFDDYVRVPDRFHGDCGIEGFTYSGKAFQFYAPDEILTAKEIYTNQVNKITKDLNKLIKHKKELKQILGDVKIKNWIFLTPQYDNKDILKHCRKKEQKIKEFNLEFIDVSFRVKILTYKHFLPEIQVLIDSNEHILKLEIERIRNKDIKQWKVEHNDYYKEIYRKLFEIYQNPKETEEKVHFYIKNYLIGWNHLTNLLNEFPKIHQNILSKKNICAIRIESYKKSDNISASDHLKSCFDLYENDIAKEKLIHEETIFFIAYEAIGEWLGNCTIEFEG